MSAPTRTKRDTRTMSELQITPDLMVTDMTKLNRETR